MCIVSHALSFDALGREKRFDGTDEAVKEGHCGQFHCLLKVNVVICREEFDRPIAPTVQSAEPLGENHVKVEAPGWCHTDNLGNRLAYAGIQFAGLVWPFDFSECSIEVRADQFPVEPDAVEYCLDV